jgi:hypothetical protein
MFFSPRFFRDWNTACKVSFLSFTSLAPEGWTYWDKTDCWYHAHGDTGINSVTLSYASLDGGGTGYFQFENAFGQICSIGFVLGQTEADAGHVYLRYCIAQ